MFRFVLVAVLFLAPSFALSDISGQAHVIDGDTIEIAGERIRLHGIDAPELKQTCKTEERQEEPCGQLAKQILEAHIRGQEVVCKGNERDRYRRLIAVCYVGQLDLNARMVATGWALAYRRYSEDYVQAENLAKSRRKGIWRGDFVPPWEWRRK